MSSDRLVSGTCGPLAVRDHGGKGPSAVVLHGAGHNLEVWAKVAGALHDDARVVAIDLRGHGHSAYDASFTLADLADDVATVCAEMALDSPVLVGHSLGGWVALTAAAVVPVQQLIVVEGPVMSMKVLFRELGLPADSGSGQGLAVSAFHGDDAAWRARVQAAGPPGSVARAVVERGVRRGADGLLHSYPPPEVLLAARRCIWQIDPAAAYREVGVPTTLVLGDRPPPEGDDIRRRHLAALNDIEGFEVVWLTGGHHLPAERPYDLADVIVAAMRQARGWA